jgi:hypothetical protein
MYVYYPTTPHWSAALNVFRCLSGTGVVCFEGLVQALALLL